MSILTFGYGSNMLLRKLHINVPSATKVSNAVLTGYRFAFNKLSKDCSGKGNIIQTNNPGDSVCGVIIQVSDSDKKALNNEEGLGKGYDEKKIIVKPDMKEPIEVVAYIASPDSIKEDLWPYDWYRDMVINGALENNLPEDYIAFLKEFSFTIDPDQKRRLEKYAIINTQME